MLQLSTLSFSFIIVALFACSSCSKTTFRISVTFPPVIAVPEDVNSFIIVNNVTESNSPDELLKKALGGQMPNGNLIAAGQCVTGLLRAFDDSRYFRGIALQQAQLREANQMVDWKAIDSLCAASAADGIIEIATFRSQAPVGGVIADNAMGKTSSPLRGTAYFNIYLPSHRSFLEQLDISDVFHIPIAGNLHPLNLLNDVMRKREYYGALGFSTGRRMGASMSSSWQWVSRQYYKKGSREIKLSKNLIRKGHWDLAEQQLASALNNPKPKASGRAKFNMALVHEGQGHLNKAIELAEQAALANIKPAYDYINMLKRRLSQQSAIYFP